MKPELKNYNFQVFYNSKHFLGYLFFLELLSIFFPNSLLLLVKNYNSRKILIYNEETKSSMKLNVELQNCPFALRIKVKSSYKLKILSNFTLQLEFLPWKILVLECKVDVIISQVTKDWFSTVYAAKILEHNASRVMVLQLRS